MPNFLKINGNQKKNNGKKSRRKDPERGQILAGFKQDIFGILLIAFGIFAVVANFTDATGAIGFYVIKVFMKASVGVGIYLFPIFVIMLGIVTMLRQEVKQLSARITGLVLLYLSFITSAQIYSQAYFTVQFGPTSGAGGFLGFLLRGAMERSVGMIGAYIILTALYIISFLLIADISVGELISDFVENLPWVKKKEGNKKRMRDLYHEKYGKPQEEAAEEGSIPSMMATIKEGAKPLEEAEQLFEKEFEEEVKTRAYKPLRDYKLPPMELLDMPSDKEREQQESLKESTMFRKKVLEEALKSFGVEAKVTDIKIGPVVTRFEVQPEPGVKVSRISNLADDIALNLAAQGVRIEAPVPGKSVVGIEVANASITPVRLGEILRTNYFQKSKSQLLVGVGKDISGNPIFGDLSTMPHLLVAGTTGSGKSVCINSLIASLLMRLTPEEVKFLMIDPKMVELSNYNDIPHLIAPVVTDPRKAAATLKHWAMAEMDRRYKEFHAAGMRNIIAYNNKVEFFKTKSHEMQLRGFGQEDETFVPQKLPYLVIIIDELADLMMVAAVEVETTICRIAQMARATGIHLVIATQRPSVDIITGLIKANIPSRIAFAVATQVDSRVVLDMSGAEKLLGRGDMLYHPIGAMKAIRMQGSYITDSEIEKIIEHVKEQASPEYLDEVMEIKIDSGARTAASQQDEMFFQAALIIVESGQASTSHLQRRLRIGYNRAARLMDEMEAAGVVSKSEGENKPRRILASRETLKAMGVYADS